MLNQPSTVIAQAPTVKEQINPPVAPKPSPKTNDYVALKRLVKDQGLMERQPGHTIVMLAFIAGLFVAGLVGLYFFNPIWLVPIWAVYFAFVFVQLGFISHDVGHRQVYAEGWKNDVIGYFVGRNFVKV